jgi:hypothetical protein
VTRHFDAVASLAYPGNFSQIAARQKVMGMTLKQILMFLGTARQTESGAQTVDIVQRAKHQKDDFARAQK